MLGTVGIVCVLSAALLGGAFVPLGDPRHETFLGLDWFVLNLMVYSAVYIPLERFFAKYPEQPTFRKEWHVDLAYFFINTLLVQITSLLTVQPAMVLFDWARVPWVATFVARLPILLQVPLCVLVADFAQYWIHRAFHSVPMLWRFHAIHHSVEAMDWLAGSRLHLFDAILTRGLTFIPIYVLGFSQAAVVVYVIVVVVQATFIHANVKWEFAPVRRVVATPCFHHWHHAAEPEAVDKNFAVHTPLWDWLFGTYYLPERWPRQYGLCGERDVPSGWFSQLIHPFRPPANGTSALQTLMDPSRSLFGRIFNGYRWLGARRLPRANVRGGKVRSRERFQERVEFVEIAVWRFGLVFKVVKCDELFRVWPRHGHAADSNSKGTTSSVSE
ncbi:MAG: sterol desaturase family protein [Planctomycetota bacterium]